MFDRAREWDARCALATGHPDIVLIGLDQLYQNDPGV
jgi:hypothetical protein